MALPHAKLLDVIHVAPLGPELDGQVSTSLIKTDRIQLLHLVLAAHQDQPFRHVGDECTIQCIEGLVEVVMGAGTKQLRPGDLIVLPAQQEHALRARDPSAVLVTLVLKSGDAGDGGGSGARTLQPG